MNYFTASWSRLRWCRCRQPGRCGGGECSELHAAVAVAPGLLGLGAAGALARTTPGDPAGYQTIPEPVK